MNESQNAVPYIEYPDEQTYVAFKAIASDAKETFGQPYRAWVTQGEEYKKRMAQQGLKLIGILATPKEFAEWCSKNSLPTDTKARAAFAAFKLATRSPNETT
jgi:hypothetical protein